MNVDKPSGSLEARPGKASPKRKTASRKAARAGKARRAPRAKAADKGRRNKAAFVRDQPVRMPAKDVVAAAARLGMTMTPDYGGIPGTPYLITIPFRPSFPALGYVVGNSFCNNASEPSHVWRLIEA